MTVLFGHRLKAGLDSGLWTLDSGLWTLDSGLWTLDSGPFFFNIYVWIYENEAKGLISSTKRAFFSCQKLSLKGTI